MSRGGTGPGLVDRFAFGLFVLALCAGSFAYGVAATKWRLFPVPLLYQAKAGLDALLDLESKNDPPGMVRYSGDQTLPVINAFASGPEHDAILVTGGFLEQPQLCPNYGCLAWVMNRDGKVLHKWEIDPKSLFSNEELSDHSGFPSSENLIVQGISPTADGGLVVTLQGRNMFPYYVGVFRLNAAGEVLWKSADYSHHWPRVLQNGDVALPMAEILQPAPDTVADTALPSKCTAAVSAIYQEGVRIRDDTGAIIREFYFEDLLIKSDLKGLIYAVRDDCDPYHINGIAELNASAASQIAGAEPGDLVISLRSPSAILIVDRIEDVVHHVLAGPMVAQHAPVVFPDGRIGVFDNLGGDLSQGGSRILAFDLTNGTHETLFPRPGSGERLSSEAQGSFRLSADGLRALVGETLNGRLLEIDLLTGQTLWEFQNYTDLSLFNTEAGIMSEAKGALMNAQGGHFVTQSDVARFYSGTAQAAANLLGDSG